MIETDTVETDTVETDTVETTTYTEDQEDYPRYKESYEDFVDRVTSLDWGKEEKA